MTQVVLKAKYPTSSNSYGWVWVDLIGPAGPTDAVELGDHALVYESILGRTRLSNTGQLTVELDPLDELTPSGLGYRVSFQKTGMPEPDILIIGGFTGAGPVYATDHIIDLADLVLVETGGLFATFATSESGGLL